MAGSWAIYRGAVYPPEVTSGGLAPHCVSVLCRSNYLLDVFGSLSPACGGEGWGEGGFCLTPGKPQLAPER